jgi:putative sugar O-methyltransferase
MIKLVRIIKKLVKATYVLLRQFLRTNFKPKIYTFAKEYRSESENGTYASAILNILKSQKNFANFKRNRLYRDILEHVSEEQGNAYLDVLKLRNDGILKHALETVLLSDTIGNPLKFRYTGYFTSLSPTTLRYVKVSSDLKILFGEDLGDVVEIGCGYGGQTLVNDQILNVRSAKLFDLPIVNKLIRRYLNTHLLHGAFKTTSINEEVASSYDLAISNYAFSELPKKLQLIYITKVLSKSRKGYLTMNSGLSGGGSIEKLSLKELRYQLPNFETFEEKPLTGHDNYIIVWGHDKNKALEYFTIKN